LSICADELILYYIHNLNDYARIKPQHDQPQQNSLYLKHSLPANDH